MRAMIQSVCVCVFMFASFFVFSFFFCFYLPSILPLLLYSCCNCCYCCLHCSHFSSHSLAHATLQSVYWICLQMLPLLPYDWSCGAAASNWLLVASFCMWPVRCRVFHIRFEYDAPLYFCFHHVNSNRERFSDTDGFFICIIYFNISCKLFCLVFFFSLMFIRNWFQRVVVGFSSESEKEMQREREGKSFNLWR